MWFNGVPATTVKVVTLIVWKDYNCKDWKFIGQGESGVSTFTQDQMIQLATEVEAITKEQLTDDIWGTAHNMMKALEPQSGFSSAATPSS